MRDQSNLVRTSRRILALFYLVCLMESSLPGARRETVPAAALELDESAISKGVSLEMFACAQATLSPVPPPLACPFMPCFPSHLFNHFPFSWLAQFPSFSIFNTLTARSNYLCGTAYLDLSPHLIAL
jgi:hypothetical protein